MPWLLGVATNANRNRTRGSRRHADFLARLPHSDPRHGEHAADHAEPVASRLDAERAVRELLDTTAGLNDSERDVVVLCLMNGIGQEEAAKTLGVRTGTVKSRLHRARAKLAAMNRALEALCSVPDSLRRKPHRRRHPRPGRGLRPTRYSCPCHQVLGVIGPRTVTGNALAVLTGEVD